MEEALTIKETLALWGSAMGWTLVGIAFFKAWQYDKTVTFKPLYWVKNNILDVIRGVLLTMVVLKLGDITVELLKYLGIDFTNVNVAFAELGTDPVQLSLVISIIAQYYIYKRSKPKTIK